MRIKCIAVDDEALALNKITRYVDKIDFLELLKTFDNAIDALQFIREEPVDLMFLDIQMDDLTGIQLLKTLKNPPMVIFTTAYESYALEGYELDVLDYLLKPIQFERFVKACDKALNKLLHVKKPQSGSPLQPAASFRDQSVFIKSGNSVRKVNLKDIRYIEGLKDYLLIHTDQGRIITLQTFTKMLDMLPRDYFVRIHKSYVISIPRIDRIDRNLVYIGDKAIPVGITYKSIFQKLTNGFLTS